MKTKILFILGATTVAAVIFATETVQADDLSAAANGASKITKGPVLASPHYLEDFPGLTRPEVADSKIGQRSPAVPGTIRNNQALANSPRVREDYSALARIEQPPTSGESAQLKKARQNSALANSPRVREDFPELLRESGPQTEEISTNIALSKEMNTSDRN